MVEITIVYDNTAIDKRLTADWGFAALIRAPGKNILFDTGANGEVLLKNMRMLKIDPGSVSDVFISHGHFDHTGGLSHFLNENKAITLHAPTSFRGVRYAREVIYYEKPQEIFKHVYTSGELDHIEQSLAIETGKGLLVITGCSHPKIDNIFGRLAQFGTLYGIIGGLHGFDQYPLFEGLELICPTHCTRHINEIKARFPEKYSAGGAGAVIRV